MKSKLMLVALLAFAAGGTCPSDVNNDGTVGINDFLQVLGDWGPCPSSKVISMSYMSVLSTTTFLVQLRSDRQLQVYMLLPGHPCLECDESFPELHVWTDFTPPPVVANEFPVELLLLQNNLFYVVYSNGTVYQASINISQIPGGTNCDGKDYCTISLGDWRPLP